MRPSGRSRAGLYGGVGLRLGTGVGESAAATAAGGMQGFPAALSSFIGRAGAVRDVVALLGECRLVTVTGPGGVGKTRLAGQVAGRFADGARLAGLAAVRSGLGPGGGGRGAEDTGAAGGACGRGAGSGAGPAAAAASAG